MFLILMKNYNTPSLCSAMFAGLLQDLSVKHRIQVDCPDMDSWFGSQALLRSTVSALGCIGKVLDSHLAGGGTPWEVIKTDQYDEATDRLDVKDWCFSLAEEVAIQSAPIQAKILRQVFLFFSKLNLPHEQDAQNQAFLDFVNRDRDLLLHWSKDHRSEFRKSSICYHAREFITRVLSNMPRDYYPKHGPGAVAEKESGIREKMQFSYRDSARFPFDEWFYVSPSHVVDTWGRDIRPLKYGWYVSVRLHDIITRPEKAYDRMIRKFHQTNSPCSHHIAGQRELTTVGGAWLDRAATMEQLSALALRWSSVQTQDRPRHVIVPLVSSYRTKTSEKGFSWWDEPKDGFRSCSRVTAVPKDFRGPRIICVEPKENQWLQQGIWETIARRVHSHPYTKDSINFHDQELSRVDALKASETNARSTIDLKEASDRISLDLIYCLFGDSRIRDTYLDLLDTRSRKAEVRGIGAVKLRKFASMGSALCFPVQSLTFLALCVGAIAPTDTSVRVNYRPLARRFRVFGDDIILPRDDASRVIAALTMAGLKLNMGKCCISGSFKESCGCDAYNGVDVTPIRWKTVVGRHVSAEDLAAIASCHNHLRMSGYVRTADAILAAMQEKLPHLLILPENWGGVGLPFGAFLAGRQVRAKLRYTRKLKGFVVDAISAYTYQAVSRKEKPLDGWPGLLAALSGNSPGRSRRDVCSHSKGDRLSLTWVRLGV